MGVLGEDSRGKVVKAVEFSLGTLSGSITQEPLIWPRVGNVVFTYAVMT